tara:strand:- start:1267 stop:2073 length:807 start_codon:yes stop_codon:yes gene_type:complete
MKSIILAAGKGSRLKATLPNDIKYITKSMALFNGVPAICRLVKQIEDLNLNTPLIITGHESEKINYALKGFKINILYNKSYAKDSNILSVLLGLDSILNEETPIDQEGVLIIEADSIFANHHLKNFINYIKNELAEESKTNNNLMCWSSKGEAIDSDTGGFLLSPEPISKNHGIISKAYITKSNTNKFARKMYGITWFSQQACKVLVEKAKLIINSDNDNDLPYFHNAVMDFAEQYSMRFYQFKDSVYTYNDYNDYLQCLNAINSWYN